MADIIKFKLKPENDKKTSNFLEQLDFIRELYLRGELENVFIAANGRIGKCCTSNGVNVANAKEICWDFIYHTGEYIG